MRSAILKNHLNLEGSPKLNTQGDFIGAKLFMWTASGYYFIVHILLIRAHTLSV